MSSFFDKLKGDGAALPPKHPIKNIALAWLGTICTLALSADDARAEGTARAALDGLLVVDGDAVAGGGALSLGLGYDFELSPLLLEPEIRGSFGLNDGDFAGVGSFVVGGRFLACASRQPKRRDRASDCWG